MKKFVKTGTFRTKYAKAIPTIIEGLPRRSLPQLLALWRNLLPHIAGRNEHSTSPLAIELRDAIIGEWTRRAVTAILDPDKFDWPSTDAPGGNGHIGPTTWKPEGMLSFLGYHVGITNGLRFESRRSILDAAYLFPLPPINGSAYMAEWGEANTGHRLRKLAESLAAFSRNAKRRRDDRLATAISEWESDLDYLYTHYYVGRFVFTWPR